MIRVRIARAHGSTPREEGAQMLVTGARATGSVGGGRLEEMAISRARDMLASGEAAARLDVALGPEIGQCCGGAVTLVFDRVAPCAAPTKVPALIFGAGHVGRALGAALAPLPIAPRLIDAREAELAKTLGVSTTLTALPEAEVRAAPARAIFVILTHDHALDFLIACEALKRGDALYVGMIGSKTKRALFERHAAREGVATGALVCPLAASAPRDKRPEVIAAFTAAEILTRVVSGSATAGRGG